MAIYNNLCNKCNHKLVCIKQTILVKFNDETKDFIGINVKMENCNDFDEIND